MSQDPVLFLLLGIVIFVSLLNLFAMFLVMARDKEELSAAYYAVEEEEMEPITQPLPKIPAQAWVDNPTFHQLPAMPMFPIHHSDYPTLRHRIEIGQFQQRLFLH